MKIPLAHSASVSQTSISKSIPHYSVVPHCLESVQIQSFSDPHFPVYSPNTEKYGPEKTLYLDIFHTVPSFQILSQFLRPGLPKW